MSKTNNSILYDDKNKTKTQENLKKALNTETDSLITTRIARQILSINGNTDRSYIANFVNSMPILDSKSFRKYAGEIEPDIVMKSEFTCKNCGETNEVDIPITTEFFWPSGI